MLECVRALSTAISPLLSQANSPSNYNIAGCSNVRIRSTIKALSLRTRCSSRRRVRYEEAHDDDDEDYGHNEEIAMLELYSQSARDEALLVKAILDEQEVEVLIFKGFSSCLSFGTSSDPSKSVLPARAVIKSIDRVRGPFDPSNIEYLQKDLTWEVFKNSLLSN